MAHACSPWRPFLTPEVHTYTVGMAHFNSWSLSSWECNTMYDLHTTCVVGGVWITTTINLTKTDKKDFSRPSASVHRSL